MPQSPRPASGRRSGALAAVALLLCALGARASDKLEVVIAGPEGELLDNIRAHLSLIREEDQPILDDYRVGVLYRRAPQEIRTALEPFGYFNPVIEPSLTRTGDQWRALLRVDPGEPVRVTEVDLQITGAGAGEPPFTAWKREFPLKKGQPLQQPAYEQAKGALLAIAERLGYREAELTEHRLAVNAGQGSAVIRLHLATGPRYRFGSIDFDEIPLSHDLLQHYLPFRSGDPFDADKLGELQRALADSDYFERVEVAPLPAVAGAVPVAVHLAMRAQTRYTTGVGYGTDTGPRLTAGIERRWLNARGDRIDARAMVSTVTQELNAEYRIPFSHPQTDYFAVRSNLQHEKTSTSDRDTGLISAGVTQSRGVWVRTIALNLQQEAYEVGSESHRSTMLYPSFSWQQVSADDRIAPERGYRLGAVVRVASESLGSSTSLLQGQLTGKAIYPLGRDRLIGRFDLGGSRVTDFEALPVSLRFFAGGDQSVRGFGYNTLGPKNAKGEVVGGKFLMVGSVEYDHYFDDRYGMALFYDTGSAFNVRPETLDQGAGIGLRVKLPFAVVRVDIASALTDPDHPWRLHLSIGPEL